MCKRTLVAAPRADQIVEARPLDVLLFTDLAADRDLAVNVQERNELGKSVQEAALADGLSVPPELDAGAEKGANTCNEKNVTIAQGPRL